jgi:hypothetical protein
MPISRADLLKELLPGLEKLFGDEYAKTHHIEYRMKSSYGKYSIYKWEYNGGIRKKSTTLAKHLSREEAIGMMKLLKEPK